MFDNIKKNWAIVRADPKKWALFNVKVIQIVIGTLALIIAWRFLLLIIGLNTGNSGAVSMIGKALAFLVMCILMYKIYTVSYVPLRDRILHDGRVKNPPKIENYNNQEIDEMIDDTINEMEKKKKEGLK